jgi:hypothetical protein
MPSNAQQTRNRVVYATLIVLVIATGLASRKYPDLLPAELGKYPGDALWALMVFLLLGFCKPTWSIAIAATTALVGCYMVEFSQMYQAPWIVAIRQTTLGHLVLGSTFHAQDLIAYAAGIAFGASCEWFWLQASNKSPH